MNNFDILSASVADSLKQNQGQRLSSLGAHEALLASLALGNHQQMLQGSSSFFQKKFGLGNHGQKQHRHQNAPMMPFPNLLDVAAASNQELIQNMLSQQLNRQVSSLLPTSPLPGNSRGVLGLQSSPAGLLDLADRRRMTLDKIQSIRQQALALTDDISFRSVDSTGLHSLLRPTSGDAHSSPLAQPLVDETSLPKQQGGTLQTLGSATRKKNSPYIDASSLSDPDPEDLAKRRTRGGVTEPFPEKLHRMLREVEESGNSNIISFFLHGRAFGVHDPEKFVSEIMPKYFKQSRLSSFQRQLNLYGFTRISSGPDTGGYYHELFLQGRPALCVHMRRVGVPQGEDRRKQKTASKKVEPDFYSMKSISPSKESLQNS